MTGQYPLRHGVFVNDVPLETGDPTLAGCFREAGYDTAYIGKWHIHGSPDGRHGRRSAPVPREKRYGFEYWKAFECSHNYLKSPYYEGDDPNVRFWDGYDACAQTDDACAFLRARTPESRPFLLTVSWGTPHDPYHLVPDRYLEPYAERRLQVRDNVPEALRDRVEHDLRGYYAHIAALDECVGRLLETLEDTGLARNTIFVFTSDHGDMHGSQGLFAKHGPWDESIRVPFLVRGWTGALSRPREVPLLLDAPDVMPTLLGLAGVPVPATVQGRDCSAELKGERAVGPDQSAFLGVQVSYGMLRTQGLPAYRGVRTRQYTYARGRDEFGILYDNDRDPLQRTNLFGARGYRDLQSGLETLLQGWLARLGDEFLSSDEYLHRDGLEHYVEATSPFGAKPNPWTCSGPG
jgi:arylsulfatase A-like enzyme